MTSRLSELAHLAQAAYAHLGAEEIVNALQNSDTSRFSFTQAERFAGRFSPLRVLNHLPDDSTGLSLTLISDTQTGKHSLAIRGTSNAAIDFLQDAKLAITGVAADQFVNLYRYYRRLTTAPDQFVTYTPAERQVLHALRLTSVSLPNSIALGAAALDQQLALDRGIAKADDQSGPVLEAGTQLTVVGHSLGGHLALLFARAFPFVTEHVYTFNAPGISAIAEVVLNAAGLLPYDPSRVTNVVADQGIDLTSMFGTKPGATERVFIEDGSGLHNHGIAQLSDSLALYELFARLSPGMETDLPGIKLILEAASRRSVDSLERALDILGRMLDGSSDITPVAAGSADQVAREAYYVKLFRLRDAFADGRDWGISTLIGHPGSEIAGRAATEFAYRHALWELSPFVVSSADLPVANLDALSDGWLTARAELLSTLLKANLADAPYVSSDSLVDIRYANLGRDEHVFALSAATLAELEQLPFPVTEAMLSGRSYGANVVFGAQADESIAGSGGWDSLFGGAGSDRIHGLAGADYLEGGEGADTLDGGADDDELVGGSGDSLAGGGGFDTYRVDTAASEVLLSDSDGLGEMFLDGDLLGLAYRKADGRFEDGQGHAYEWSADSLLIDGRVEVAGFTNGDLGIRLLGAPLRLVPIALGNENEIYQDEDGGQDALDLAGGEDFAFGGRDDDEIEGGEGNDFLIGGRGDDVLFAVHRHTDSLLAAPRAGGQFFSMDILSGGDGADTLSGSGTDDHLEGGPGDDILVGGAGNDALYGDSTWQAKSAGEAYGVVVGGDHPDIDLATGFVHLDGLDPEDPIYGLFTPNGSLGAEGDPADAGNDELDGGAGDDTLHGGWGNDTLHGGEGAADSLAGGEGEDLLQIDGSGVLSGGGGHDRLLSGVAPVTQHGGEGNDTLEGALTGGSQLRGGPGDDELTGHASANTYYIGGGDILRFNPTSGNNQALPDEGFPERFTVHFADEITPADIEIVQYAFMPLPHWKLAHGGVYAGVQFQGARSQWGDITGIFADGTVWTSEDFAPRVAGAAEFVVDLAAASARPAGNDVLVGSGSDDDLAGGAGDDLYRLHGGGSDVIHDTGGNDVVALYGVRADETQVFIEGDDYLLRYPGGELRIVAQVPGAIETLYLDDFSTTWTAADLASRAVSLPDHAPAPLGLVEAVAGTPFRFEVPEDAFGDVELPAGSRYGISALGNAAIPSWLTFDAQAGVLAGTPGPSDSGVTSLLVSLQGGTGAVAATPVVISVAAAEVPPAIPAFKSLLSALTRTITVVRDVVASVAERRGSLSPAATEQAQAWGPDSLERRYAYLAAWSSADGPQEDAMEEPWRKPGLHTPFLTGGAMLPRDMPSAGLAADRYTGTAG